MDGEKNNNRKRSSAEIVVAVAACIGLAVSFFTGIRAYYVNEYRIDMLEAQLHEVRIDVRKTRDDIQELDHSMQRLIGAATQQGKPSERKP